jgi:hypothetical protein
MTTCSSVHFVAAWSSGMIPVSGTGGHGFNSRSGPFRGCDVRLLSLFFSGPLASQGLQWEGDILTPLSGADGAMGCGNALLRVVGPFFVTTQARVDPKKVTGAGFEPAPSGKRRT